MEFFDGIRFQEVVYTQKIKQQITNKKQAHLTLKLMISCLLNIPVVPHKAVAEVSRIGNYRRDWLL